MSKYNNVNPDHYKLAGRERPGKTAEAMKTRAHSSEQEERERWAARHRNREPRGAKSAESGVEEPEVEREQPEGQQPKGQQPEGQQPERQQPEGGRRE
jgi:hypothetical protein